MSPFRSKLLWKASLSVVLGLAIWFPLFYWLTVPFVNKLAYQVEEKAARTVLDNLTEIVALSHKDLEAWRETSLEAHRRELKNIVLVVDSLAKGMEADVAAGKQSKAAARKQLLDKLKKTRYGNDGYLWGVDYQYKIVSHPDAAFHSRDATALRDSQGNLVVPSMVKQARGAGDGYFSYWWKRPDANQEEAKLSYVRDFPNWQLVVGTGVYIGDIDQEVARRKEELISNLRQHLRRVALADSGYVFIFDGKSQVIVHPDARLEGVKADKEVNPVTGNSITSDLMAAAKRPDKTLFYQWDRPNDPGNFSYPKVAWVHHFPEYDWYIVASAYSADLGRSGNYLSDRLLIAFVLGLVITALIGLVFIRKITGPILRLAEVARQNVAGDLSAVSDIRRNDEIGVLADAFNSMVARIKEQIDTLEERVQDRTHALAALNLQLESRVDAQTAEIKASEAKFRGLLEQSLAGIFVIQDDVFRYVNLRFAEIHGYAAPSEIIDRLTYQEVVAPRDLERLTMLKCCAVTGETVRTDLTFTGLKQDGSEIELEVSARVIDYEGKPATIGMALDVTERAKMQRALAKQQADLEEMVASRTSELMAANRELESFTFATSHDLRGPLGRINSFSVLLEKQYRDKLGGNGLLYLEFIRQNSTRLTQLVDDLLHHARIAHQDLELKPVDVLTRILVILEENAEDIREANADVRVNVPPIRVLADPQTLTQVLSNLLQNALKYSASAEPPVIEIGAEERDSGVVVWIRDNGIGFDMAYHDKIFEIFRRLHTYSEYEGSGVGLALVKRAMGRMGGRVWADSEPDRGATFYLEFKRVHQVAGAREMAAG